MNSLDGAAVCRCGEYSLRCTFAFGVCFPAITLGALTHRRPLQRRPTPATMQPEHRTDAAQTSSAAGAHPVVTCPAHGSGMVGLSVASADHGSTLHTLSVPL